MVSRLRRAWQSLPPERRAAAVAAFALFATLFLPWYQQTAIATGAGGRRLQSLAGSLTGWGAFSFVEAAVLLVSLSVLVLLFKRAEGSAFHLPGGDGWAITFAGAWTCFLIVWRMFDKSGTTNHGYYATSVGVEWGIFAALLVAAILTWAGIRIRRAHRPEPPLPDGVVFDGRWHDGPRRSSDREQARRPAPAASPTPGRRAARAPRSSWRPAERPEWSEPPERPVGWLTAPPAAGTDANPDDE